MEQEIRFNILGCCICRDVFAIPDMSLIGNQNNRYKVNKFYQFSSPCSFMEKNGNFLFEPWLISDMEMVNFNKKCICGDLNKNNLEETLQDSDYYVFDLSEFRFPVGKIVIGNRCQVFTMTKNFREVYAYLKKREWKEAQVEEVEYTLEQCIQILEKYIEKVLSVYQQEKCIMLENYLVKEYIDTVKGTFLYDRESFVDTVNEKLYVLYNYVKNNYPEINVIKNPSNNLGNIHHKWGKDNLHFMDEFYVYAIQAVNYIVENKDGNMRKKKLEALCQHYSMLFKRIREGIIAATLVEQGFQKENLLNDGHFNDLGVWLLSKSVNSGYNAGEKRLYCNDAEKGWSILTQRLEETVLEKYSGNMVCFSVDAISEKKCKFYMMIGYHSEGKYVSLITDKKTVSEKLEKKYISCKIENIPEKAVLVCRVYVTDYNSSVRIDNAVLQIGTVPNMSIC